jgi:hypothetical protein
VGSDNSGPVHLGTWSSASPGSHDIGHHETPMPSDYDEALGVAVPQRFVLSGAPAWLMGGLIGVVVGRGACRWGAAG